MDYLNLKSNRTHDFSQRNKIYTSNITKMDYANAPKQFMKLAVTHVDLPHSSDVDQNNEEPQNHSSNITKMCYANAPKQFMKLAVTHVDPPHSSDVDQNNEKPQNHISNINEMDYDDTPEPCVKQAVIIPDPPNLNGDDQNNGKQKNPFIFMFKMFFALLSIILFYVDVGTDLALAISYLNHSHYIWFGLTLTFVLGPSILNSILNLCLYYHDYKKEQDSKSKDPIYRSSSTLWIFRIVFTVLQMGPVVRGFERLRYGMKSMRVKTPDDRKYYIDWMLREDVDACMLCLFEGFMESAPQLTLQLYILVVDPTDASNPLRIISLLISWISICWAMTAYHKAFRFFQKKEKHLSVCASVGFFMWRLHEVGPRILIISMFTTQYNYWVAVPLTLHWVFVFIWLQKQKLEFIKGAVQQTFFNMMCAFISIFCSFDTKCGTSRFRYMLFYAIFYAENIVMFALWFHFTDHKGTWFHLTALCFVLSGAVLHAMLFSIYYYCCHPKHSSLDICKEYNSHEIFISLGFSNKTDEDVKKESARSITNNENQ